MAKTKTTKKPGKPSKRPNTKGRIVWKKAVLLDQNGYIKSYILVKLRIPPTAETNIKTMQKKYDRYWPFGWARKFRASEAVVLGFYGVRTGKLREDVTEATSEFSPLFHYRRGETVKPRLGFDSRLDQVCTSGIHFFLTQKEAAAYEP